ncbi:glycogen synthase GlgA [Lacticigenium naphthae]|uniref:glycogen synthase GlgA n=1 Tax=Lacticigenium naphthae TaxID=515351 RepID=UPI00041853CA|nr:glycogen synthase GlgA [Lacticigenium naphthae]
MKVLFASSEAAPFFKSGGLGDVAGALPKEMKKQGLDIRVVLPLHSKLPAKYKEKLKEIAQFEVKVGWRSQYCGVKTLDLNDITYYFIDSLYYFDRDQLYGEGDDGERYAFFSQALIEMMEKVDFIPDVLHLNDWHTAIVPVLLKDKYHWVEKYRDIKTVLTIHNLQFQGIFDQSTLSDLYGIGYNAFHDHGLEFFDNVNVLKGGIYYSDLVTTVSPTYAEEIKTAEFGYGLEGVLQDVGDKLVGILNGIDTDIYNPQTDPSLVVNYSIDSLDKKVDNKTALQERVGLPVSPEIALIGMVGRLTEQKGADLIEQTLGELMYRDVQVLILGTGDPRFENSFASFNQHHSDKFKAIIDFDVELAQQIYAGADIFLMPSAFEPCGLSQLNSLRYGTLPLVHETGGLVDTVEPFNPVSGKGTGFSFYDYNPLTMLKTIDHALTEYYDNPQNWKELMKQAMKKDFSWEKSASKYIDNYKKIAL